MALYLFQRPLCHVPLKKPNFNKNPYVADRRIHYTSSIELHVPVCKPMHIFQHVIHKLISLVGSSNRNGGISTFLLERVCFLP